MGPGDGARDETEPAAATGESADEDVRGDDRSGSSEERYGGDVGGH
jgi:hypothetical protein